MMECCPAPQQLADLLADKLTGDTALAVEAHVEACPSCQRALERLSGACPLSPTSLVNASRHVRAASPDDAFLRRLEQQPHLTMKAGDASPEDIRMTAPQGAVLPVAVEPPPFPVMRLWERSGGEEWALSIRPGK
jgi:anti-sigma factor RsiW